jgi:tRNA threonylcarbamoyladenosine biosynthesis protein TsaE
MSASKAASGATVLLHSDSLERTHKVGEHLGKLVEPGDVILLVGNLGAGKTALTQGIGAGMGVATIINSPTFTILKEYDGRLPLYHFDLYRIDSPEEIFSLGFDDYFADGGVCVVEWAERGEAQGASVPWPESFVRVEMDATPGGGRTLRIIPVGVRAAALVNAWVQAASEER